MYNFFKLIALFSIIVHTILYFEAATSWFNAVFILISALVLLLPKKRWYLYILPLILVIIGLGLGSFLLFFYFNK